MLSLLRMVASSDKLHAGHYNDALKNPSRLVARLQTAVTLSGRMSRLNALPFALSAEGQPPTDDAGDGGDRRRFSRATCDFVEDLADYGASAGMAEPGAQQHRKKIKRSGRNARTPPGENRERPRHPTRRAGTARFASPEAASRRFADWSRTARSPRVSRLRDVLREHVTPRDDREDNYDPQSSAGDFCSCRVHVVPDPQRHSYRTQPEQFPS
jgi:hypothetical protein